ncbi:hypothetical protein OO006_00200 [Prosthecochloris sp. SCSIO W1101]|nr:hypothetical protein [Prosthecochloris sp. SCSIO W1101]UZJ41474.1 hypothetical protein OO006_00200 [Prosthecochloris sp. SCSIO W1101]
MTVLPLSRYAELQEDEQEMNRIDDYRFPCTKSGHDALRMSLEPEFN